ncbi:MAG: hypothetical protein RSE51_07450 [Bacteroidales bacterium]
MSQLTFKKTMFVSFATAALLSAVACSESDDKNITELPSKIEVADFSVTTAQGDSTLTFYAANNWSATLNTTSWISIDPSTKLGPKGNAEIKLLWKESTSLKERSADLTIAVENEAPVKIRITQFSNEPSLVINQESSALKVDIKGNDGHGLFVDTLVVNSNFGWEVKQKPSWLDYSFLDKESQEGVLTEVTLILTGRHAEFDAAQMNGNLVLGASNSDAFDQTIPVTAKSVLYAYHSGIDQTEVSELTLAPLGSAGNRFAATMLVHSTGLWKVQDVPAWLTVSAFDNSVEYQRNILSTKEITVLVDRENLDTDANEATIKIVNEKTGQSSDIKIVFPGTGADYYETLIELGKDFSFDATRRTEDYVPVPNAVLERDFEIISAQSYGSVAEAPFQFFFVKSDKGFTYKEEVSWVGADLKAAQARTPMEKRAFELYVTDRRDDWMDLNKEEERQAYMVIAPKGVAFEDLFMAGTEDLKEEYVEKAVFIAQKGLPMAKPETSLPEEIAFAAEGGETEWFTASNFNMVSFMINKEIIPDDAWIRVELDYDEMGNVTGVMLKAKPNTTGKERSYTIELLNFVEATQSEELVMTITVTQSAE